MSRRTKNSMASLSEADIERLVLKSSDTDRSQDTVVQDSSTERFENKESESLDKKEREMPEHVVVESAVLDDNNISCHNENHNQLDLTKIMRMISELQESHETEKQNAIAQATRFEAANKALFKGQTKMAAEIEELKSTIEKLEHENKCMKMILDIKQDEWLKTEAKKCSSLKQDEQKFKISVQNSFAGLEIEDSHLTSFPEFVNDKQTEKPKQKNVSYPNHNVEQKTTKTKGNTANKLQDPPALPKEKITLVIGDSMVKNINNKKIERASGHKSVCH